MFFNGSRGMKKVYWEIFQSHPIVVFLLGSLILGGLGFGVFVFFLPEGHTPGALPIIGIFFAASLFIRYMQYARQPLESGFTELMHEYMLMEEKLKEWQDATSCSTPSRAKRALRSLEDKAIKKTLPVIEETQSPVDEDTQQEIDKLKAKLANQKGLLKKADADKKDLAKDLSQKESELNELQDTKKVVERLLSARQAALDLATKNISTLENRLNGLEGLLNDTRETHKTEVRGLSTQLHERLMEVSELKTQLETMERIVHARERLINEQNAVIRELRSFITEEGAVYSAFTELVSVADETANLSEEIHEKLLLIITPCLDAMEKFKEKSLETKEG
jgi:chromosome segregation ATPase